MSWQTKELLSHAWHTFKTDAWFWVGLLLLAYLLNFLGAMTHLGSLVNVFTCFILTSAFLRTSRGTHVDFKNLFDDFSAGKFVQYVLTNIIVGLFVIVGIFLLVIPGIIVGSMLAFTSYIIMDEPRNISWKSDHFWKAIKKSVAMTKGVRWKLFCFFLILLGINILGALALGLGLLVSIPVSGLAFAALYDKFVGTRVEPVSNIPPTISSEIVS